MSENKDIQRGYFRILRGLNLGDEAILHGIITQLDAPCPQRLRSSSETGTQGMELRTFHE